MSWESGRRSSEVADQTEPVGYKTLIGLALSLLCLASCASTLAGLFITTTTSSGAPEQIPAELLKPEGSGPFPAIVIMHDCSGLGPRSSGASDRWAKEFVQRAFPAHRATRNQKPVQAWGTPLVPCRVGQFRTQT